MLVGADRKGSEEWSSGAGHLNEGLLLRGPLLGTVQVIDMGTLPLTTLETMVLHLYESEITSGSVHLPNRQLYAYLL